VPADLWKLYPLMLRSRLFEEAVSKLWQEGLISGEMHLGTGEEAIVAGVVSQLRGEDAMALDHRGSAALIMKGVDPVMILRELLGYPDGLCGGMGGHMHLFSKEHLAASSGIVGASGPIAAGFGLAAKLMRPGSVAVAFFGDGAINQGMLMESLNLASVWNLPVVFVCKDDNWSITTKSDEMTGGQLSDRAKAFGMPAIEGDGLDVSAVWQSAEVAIQRGRSGNGPTFLHFNCVHLEGHFLGFQPIRVVRTPVKEIPKVAVPLTRSFLNAGGAGFSQRLAGLKTVVATILDTLRDARRNPANDPVKRARIALESDQDRLRQLEDQIEKDFGVSLVAAMAEVPK
jgi:TPP-dependent pyruvate/acetoin dehydrogenase alpha subunit